MINTLERRRYIRIKDTLKVRYWRPTNSQTELPEKDQHHTQFLRIENQIQLLLRHLPTQAHKFSELLQLINQKLNLLEQRINLPSPAFELKEVNLSGCGIAFALNDTEIRAGTFRVGHLLNIEIILAPYDSPIGLSAEVVGCGYEAESPKTQTLRLEFRETPSHLEDLLVHYILKRQSHLIKITRSQNNPF